LPQLPTGNVHIGQKAISAVAYISHKSDVIQQTSSKWSVSPARNGKLLSLYIVSDIEKRSILFATYMAPESVAYGGMHASLIKRTLK